MKIEQTACSETSAYKIQTPGSYPEENMQRTKHGESLDSRITVDFRNFAKVSKNCPMNSNRRIEQVIYALCPSADCCPYTAPTLGATETDISTTVLRTLH
jgi:hypothetical protein